VLMAACAGTGLVWPEEVNSAPMPLLVF